jgi:hypothetical protein
MSTTHRFAPAALAIALAAIGRTAPTPDDPCRYLAASEVEPYTGPLVAPPFRATADSAVANVKGDGCLYRGKDGRGVMVQYSAAGGREAGTVGRRVPQVVDRATDQKHDGSESQGTANAVMGPAGPGPWDNSNWFPTGTIIVYKGDASFDIDVSGTSGGKTAAMDLATKAIGRLGHPLDYDGTRAVAFAPKPVPEVPACNLIPRARAEAILGTLAHEPKPDSTGTTCTYTVKGADGQVDYPLAITWRNGYKAYSGLKHSMSDVGGLMGAPTSMPTMPALSAPQQKLAGAFGKMVGVPGMGGIAKRGMQTDSSLVGPWDSATLVHGSWLIASRHDVAVMINLGDADLDKAKALLTAACERL